MSTFLLEARDVRVSRRADPLGHAEGDECVEEATTPDTRRCIDCDALQRDHGVEVAEGRFEKRQIKIGLSDGINAEVLDGIDADARIRAKKLDGKKSGAKRGKRSAAGK